VRGERGDRGWSEERGRGDRRERERERRGGRDDGYRRQGHNGRDERGHTPRRSDHPSESPRGIVHPQGTTCLHAARGSECALYPVLCTRCPSPCTLCSLLCAVCPVFSALCGAGRSAWGLGREPPAAGPLRVGQAVPLALPLALGPQHPAGGGGTPREGRPGRPHALPLHPPSPAASNLLSPWEDRGGSVSPYISGTPSGIPLEQGGLRKAVPVGRVVTACGPGLWLACGRRVRSCPELPLLYVIQPG